MYTGVTGMAANSQALGIISDNIANANTVGYKETSSQFATLVAQPATQTRYTTGGVQSLPRAMVDQQGLLQSAASPTDLGISGNGFFVVNTQSDPTAGGGGTTMFTRAGSFRPDSDGYLVNSAGYYLMGWPTGADGSLPPNVTNLTSLVPIDVSSLTGTAEPTSSIALKANLQSTQTALDTTATPYTAGDMASGALEPQFTNNIQVYDSQGGTHDLTMGFVKTGANTWNVEIYGGAGELDTTAQPNGLVASGTLVFGADGTLQSSSTLPSTLNVTWGASSGLGSQSIKLNYGSAGRTDGITQYASPSSVISSTIDGAVFGGISSVEVGKDGAVTAIFQNGARRQVATIPLATFVNPNGLQAQSGNAYVVTGQSGALSLQQPGNGGAGTIQSSALESSTVDLAQEFANLITTQRAYSANSRVITTANDMLDDVIRIIR
jgi:flagellar hook protein FlgE